jgi:hypothetical protein
LWYTKYINTLVHADIFFFITSIAVVVLIGVILVASYYLIPTLRNFRDVSRTLKRGVDKAEEGIENAYDRIEDSSIFKFIFGKSRKKNNNK